MCQAHYFRWREKGDPGSAAFKEYDRTRVCSMSGCDSRAYARGWCKSHYERWRKTGTPEAPPLVREIGPSAYNATHMRLYRARGNATSYACVTCGVPARNWAYDHQDPGAVTVTDAQGFELLISLDPSHYQPMCIPCHRKFDKDMRTVSGSPS
jgi:hypothetical protein